MAEKTSDDMGSSLSDAIGAAITKLCSETLSPGLYPVATPIGHLGDISLRALSIIVRADHVYCEDARHSRKLLSAYAIRRPLLAYHDHNADRVRPAILRALADGKSVALISDAGTPLIADPGYKLARDAIEAGFRVFPVPGPSAAIAALVASGLPADSFFFAGFLPPRQSARRTRLAELRDVPGTLILFETANRLEETLCDIAEVLGDRPAALLRELTKRHEHLIRAPVSQIWGLLDAEERRGEMVLVLAAGEGCGITTLDLEEELSAALRLSTLKDAVKAVAQRTGASRKTVYDLALRLQNR